MPKRPFYLCPKCYHCSQRASTPLGGSLLSVGHQISLGVVISPSPLAKRDLCWVIFPILDPSRQLPRQKSGLRMLRWRERERDFSVYISWFPAIIFKGNWWYNSMGWFVRENLNRKPWVLPLNMGFPVNFPLNQSIPIH